MLGSNTNSTLVERLNQSFTRQRRPKTVQKWIDSSRLRAKWWDRNCPECGCSEMRFLSSDNACKHIYRVSCFGEGCDWFDDEKVE
jgi:hypothetical protein